MVARRRIDYRLLALAALAVAAAVVVLYAAGPLGGCEAGVSAVCLTSSRVLVNWSGDCPLTVRVLSLDGFERAYAVLEPGQGEALLSAEIAPGTYRVLAEAGGRVIGEYIVEASRDPVIVQAQALVLPNGTVLIDVLSRGSLCWRPHLVTAVLVKVNGTDYRFEGPWEPGEPIRVDLGFNVPPSSKVIVLVWDNVRPEPYTAVVKMPR